MNQPGALLALLHSSRRRTLGSVVVSQASLALSIALAGACLLLVVGTQILDWYWPLLLALACLAVGWYRLRDRIPGAYQIAQQIDRRLNLRDSLSTAWFFLENPSTYPGDARILESQRSQADQIAATIDTRTAVPLQLPRSAYSALALALVVGGLIGFRYGIRNDLNLKQPLVHLPWDLFGQGSRQMAANKDGKRPPLPPELEGIAVPQDAEDRQNADAQLPTDQGMTKVEATSAKEGKDAKDGVTSGEKGDEKGGDPIESAEKGDPAAQGDDKDSQANGDANNSNPAQKSNSKSDKPGDKGAQAPQKNENSSLMDKMRDAMSSMLSRLKMQPKADQGGKKNMPSQENSQAGANKQGKGEKGQQSQAKQEGQGSEDQESDQEGQGANKSLSAQNKAGDKGGEQNNPQEGKSGVGKQDGSKDLQDAAQQQAMGKISEILGKRSEKVTGEMMVEVGSGKQQLKTAYTQRNATHADAGGEISRDEVPLVYQQYVQKYFEQVRKKQP